MASCEKAFFLNCNQSLKLSKPPRSPIPLSAKQNSSNCVCWIICFFSCKIKLGLDSSISPYLAIIFERTLRILSSDNPWHAIASSFTTSGFMSCCKEEVSRFNSSKISE